MPNFLAPEQLESWKKNGFLLVSNLFSDAEVTALREHFMALQQKALVPGDPLREHYAPLTLDEANGDILKHYPRIMHPARFDDTAKQWMLDARLEKVLADLFEAEPIAAQSMFYFKPPGARGQALHQDNFYLNVRPGTCVAAWLSLDDADEENGGMNVVPGSHDGGVLCPHMADMEKSFTTEEVSVPDGAQVVPARMKAGEILFFNGSMIHGSTPNVSKHRFRRAFICHYVAGDTTSMSHYYFPLLRFNGETVEVEAARAGSHTCGNEEWAAFENARQLWLQDGAQASGAGID